MGVTVSNQPEPPRAGRREWIGLAALALPCMLVTMDLSVLFLAVPSLSADLSPSSTELLWITDVYGFLIAGALIIMGTLGDRVGRRRILLLGSAAFGTASVGAALSTSPEMLIAARGLQGLAGATLLPSTMALLFAMFPHEGDRMKALGLISIGFTGGAAIGPIVGGVLLDVASWHAVFLINVPAMVGVLALVPRFVPEFSNPDAPRVDLVSGALLITGLLALTYAVKRVAHGDGDVVVAACAVLGVVLGTVFLARQRRIENPLLNLALFRNSVFSAGLATMVTTTFVMFGTFFFVSQFMQLVLGLSPLGAALWSLPGIVLMTLGTMVIVPKLSEHFQAGSLMAAGAALTAVGLALVALIGTGTPPAAVAAILAVIQLGVAPIVTLGTNMVVGSAPPASVGAASGTAQTGNELGGAFGIALMGSLGTAVYRGHLSDVPAPGVSGADAASVHDTLAGAMAASGRLPADVIGGAQHAFVDGMGIASLLAAAMMAGVSVLIATRLRDRSAPTAEPERAAEMVAEPA